MFCANCGVKLADTEERCPLCNTVAYHPEIEQKTARPLYPKNRIPKARQKSKAFNGVIIILFLIPLFISLLADWQWDGNLDWFGYVAGGLALGYVVIGLPLWFRKPNPVIFVPCGMVVATLYLLYINLATGGNWFLGFAFPLMGGICVIVCTAVTLLYYLHKGRLYIWGGILIATGVLAWLVELLLDITFQVQYIGWSMYPLLVLGLLGGGLIYLGINKSAREMMERKLFF